MNRLIFSKEKTKIVCERKFHVTLIPKGLRERKTRCTYVVRRNGMSKKIQAHFSVVVLLLLMFMRSMSATSQYTVYCLPAH